MNRAEPRDRSLRKIAVLVRSLDEEAADRLLAQMPLDRAAAVREAAEELGEVDERERREIVAEFLRATGRAAPPARNEPQPSATASESAGVELQLSSAARSATPRRETLPGARPDGETPDRGSATNDRPLGFVTAEQTAPLARWIAAERESTGAVVLSLLEPAIAARVLERLPIERQRSLLQRLAQQRPVERMIAEELSHAIRKAIADEAGTIESTVGRQAVEAILAQVRDAHRMRLVGASPVDSERPHAPSVAARPVPVRTESVGAVAAPSPAYPEPTRREIRGEDVSRDDGAPRILPIRPTTESLVNGARGIAGSQRMNESERAPSSNERTDSTGRPASASREPEVVSAEEASAIQARFDRLAGRGRARLVPLLKRISPRVLRLALIGASPKLVARVVETLTRSEGRRLIEELERPGAVRLSDIVAAQRVVLAAAEALDGSDRPTTMRPITA